MESTYQYTTYQYTEIISKVKTVEEKEKLKEEIEFLIDSLYDPHGLAFDEMLKSKVREKFATVLSEESHKEGVDKKEFLVRLKNELEAAKVVKLTLGFEPTQVSLDKIWQFLFSALGKMLLLDIDYQPKIVGGAIIIYEGVFRDFSLKKYLDEELEKSAKEFMKIIAAFKRAPESNSEDDLSAQAGLDADRSSGNPALAPEAYSLRAKSVEDAVGRSQEQKQPNLDTNS